MERIAKLHIEKLPEGVYLPGLLAQGRTIAETIEIARDVARKLLESQGNVAVNPALAPAQDVFDYPLILGA